MAPIARQFANGAFKFTTQDGKELEGEMTLEEVEPTSDSSGEPAASEPTAPPTQAFPKQEGELDHEVHAASLLPEELVPTCEPWSLRTTEVTEMTQEDGKDAAATTVCTAMSDPDDVQAVHDHFDTVDGEDASDPHSIVGHEWLDGKLQLRAKHCTGKACTLPCNALKHGHPTDLACFVPENAIEGGAPQHARQHG